IRKRSSVENHSGSGWCRSDDYRNASFQHTESSEGIRVRPSDYSGHGGYSRRGQIQPVDLPGASRESAISISELNDRTRHLVEQSFGVFWVRGEVTDFKKNKNGH